MIAAQPHRVPSPRRQPPAKARPPLRVVRLEQPTRVVDRRRRARVVTAAALLLLVAGVFGLVASHVVLTQNQFRLERLEAKATEAQARYERLRLRVARLESPERIVAVAQERLGMVPPPGVTYLSPTGTADGDPAGADADDGLAAGGRDWPTVKRRLASRP